MRLSCIGVWIDCNLFFNCSRSSRPAASFAVAGRTSATRPYSSTSRITCRCRCPDSTTPGRPSGSAVAGRLRRSCCSCCAPRDECASQGRSSCTRPTVSCSSAPDGSEESALELRGAEALGEKIADEGGPAERPCAPSLCSPNWPLAATPLTEAECVSTIATSLGVTATSGGTGVRRKPSGTVTTTLCCLFQRATRASSSAYSRVKSGTRRLFSRLSPPSMGMFKCCSVRTDIAEQPRPAPG